MTSNVTKYSGEDIYDSWSQQRYSQPEPLDSPIKKEVTKSSFGDAYNNRGEVWGSLVQNITAKFKTTKIEDKPAIPATPAKKAAWGESYNQREEVWKPTVEKLSAKIKHRIWGNLQPQPVSFDTTELPQLQQKEQGKRKVCIIPGGTGHLGREYTLAYLNQGYEVVVTTRNTRNCKNQENLSYVQATLDEQSSPEFWKELVGQYADADSVELVNTLGIPHAQEGMSLRAVNVIPAAAMATALKELEDEGKMSYLKFVHLSSIGTLMLTSNDYGSSKKEAEELILKNHPKNTCILRVGYAFQQAVEGEVTKVDNTHAYGPEQLASMFFQPILGSGEQRLQPVYTGDIVEAGMNFHEGVAVVNAVGREVLTQSNFVEYFCELADKRCRKLYVPYFLAESVAEAFPMGHFSPYAVEACKRMETEDLIYDAADFEKLIGRKTKTLNDVYGNLKGKNLYYVKPPIKQHAVQAIKTIGKKMTLPEETAVVLRHYMMLPSES